MSQDIIDGLVELSPAASLHPSRPRAAEEDTVRNAGGTERRFGARYEVDRGAILIPVLADGRPDWAAHARGICINVSPDGMGVSVPRGRYTSGQPMVVGVPGVDGTVGYAGLEVRFVADMASDRIHVGGRFGGIGEVLLHPESLAPRFQAEELRLAHPFPEAVLKHWEAIGVLTAATVDRMLVCPRCRALPTFRTGCGNCGSAAIDTDRLMHHFACAHVDFVEAFETAAGLVCPKCRTRHLIVGADFDYQQGEFSCGECHWAGTELEQVAQCLRCGLRFPGFQAVEEELRGYHAQRLVPLALREAS
jgi:hypothetical protein